VAKNVRSESRKISFGKRKTGKLNGKKSYNKHNPRPKPSRGQGK